MNKTVHSPFHIVEDFISPNLCEKISDDLGIEGPTILNDVPLKHESILVSKLTDILVGVEDRYQGAVAGITEPLYQQYFENAKQPCESHGCASSQYLKKKWVRVKDIDLVGYLWIKDYNNGVPLDPSFEVYGGKLEFPAYNFSLVPQRGTMVIFPAGPHFITAISPALLGTYEHVKIGIKLRKDGDVWLYQPDKFPGTYADWFAEV
jgi:hypothetical protein